VRRVPLRRRRRGCPGGHRAGRRRLSSQLEDARALITALVSAHRTGLRIARDLLVAREMAERLEAEVDAALSELDGRADDDPGVDTVMSAVAAFEMARDDEASAARRWSGHLLAVRALIAAGERTLEPGAHGGAALSRDVGHWDPPPGAPGHGGAQPSGECSDDGR
jgi:hypothetical protein